MRREMRREVVLGSAPHIPFESAELPRTCQALIIGRWCFKESLSDLSLMHTLRPLGRSSIYMWNKTRGNKSVADHFYILLMLQLFLRWFDNINCCPPGCYRRADLKPVLIHSLKDETSARTRTGWTVGQGLVRFSLCQILCLLRAFLLNLLLR